ncbi:MAG: NUDIX domain-containing protein [Planctomycetes bacterium]|nr:NUDIX domain-containing protein [Planctomycetota bacterium]
MFCLEHRVRVFVFQVLDQRVEYLLLRHKPREEWPLGPVVGPVTPGEKIEDAIRREVLAETGLRRPVHLMELLQPQKELFGELGVVEWPYAWQAGTPSEPVAALKPGPMIGEMQWLPFDAAFRCLELGADRDALVRLQLGLQ